MPAFDHIFVVIMENHGYDEIIGGPDAPYLNQLADRYGVATNARATIMTDFFDAM